ncbi:MAG: hypothetical protein WA421_07370 [Nitrososphaeraceae archaeon]
MVRPLKADRKSVAITTVRVSPKTKQLLHQLKQKHGFATTDQVLRYYLPSDVSDNKPVFHSAREIYNLTKRDPDIDRLVKGASNEIMRSINKSGPRQSRLKSKSKPK